MSRLSPTTVALRTLRGQQLPPRCQITREQAVDLLRQLTGQDFGTDAEAWSEWLRHNPLPKKLRTNAPEFTGEIIEKRSGLEYRVRLDSGSEITALIPARVARLMFRIVPGDRVRLRQMEPGCSVVLGFARIPKT